MREPGYKLRSVGIREKIEKKEIKKNVIVETPKKKYKQKIRKKRYPQELVFSVVELFCRTKLMDGEKIINNSDEFIAKKLGVKKGVVGWILTEYLNEKWDKVSKKNEGLVIKE